MALNNLLEYGKVGLGTLLTSAGISYDLGLSNTRQAAEEAMYRGLEVVNPETIVNAHEQFSKYLSNNNVTVSDTLFAAGCIAVGAGMLASGIYNLAKNYKKETKE